jgi:hypothetical protein
MTDATKPLLLGYMRAHLLMTEEELTAAKEQLRQFAQREDYTLGTVLVEQLDTMPAAFAALVEAVDREGAVAIVVPSTAHLTAGGLPPLLTSYLKHVTGIRVLVANNNDPP